MINNRFNVVYHLLYLVLIKFYLFLKQKIMNELDYKNEYILDNKEVDVSLPGCELSDVDSLKYFFQKYLFSVENGKPNQNAATILKTWIDIIQQRSIKV